MHILAAVVLAFSVNNAAPSAAPAMLPLVSNGQSAPMEQVRRSDDDEDDGENEDGCLVNNMFCYVMGSDELHPDVADKILPMYLMGTCLPFGHLWAPLVLLDNADLNSDIFVNYLVLVLTSIAVGFIPAVGSLLSLAVSLYIAPVSMIRAWSRSIKKAEAEEDEPQPKKKKKKKKKKKRRIVEDEDLDEDDSPRRRRATPDDE